MPALTPPVCDFGWNALDFTLPGVDGKSYSLADITGKDGTLLLFICNHCPYVKAIIDNLVADCKLLQDGGIGVAAISANDPVNYPADSFDNMKLFATEHAFSFPYLFDKTQDTARAYDAICTPDFFGFNSSLELQYRGRFDASGSNFSADPSRRELLEAMRQVAVTGLGPTEQTASIGCSIKWYS